MPDLLFDVADHVATITFNRPERRNAYSPEMMCRLADAWVRCRDDDDIRAVIVTGAGDQAFTAGGDLQLLIPLFTRARPPEDEWDERLLGDLSIMNTVLLKDTAAGDSVLDKPIIAAVNGTALAGGTELLQACDIRLAVPTATFGLPEPKRGLVPGGGSMVRLARQVPYATAMEILLTGDAIDAHRAAEIGLINRVVPAEDLMAEARRIAATVAANAPLAVQAIKRAVRRTANLSLVDAFAVEAEESSGVMRSADAQEGPRAFMEKRTPKFEGR